MIEYLLDNTEAQQEISNLLSIEKDKLFEFIKQCLQETVKKVGGVDWSSITSEGVDQIIKNH
ncbi:MAG: hypothetical protein LBD11_02370 [Candidatus Peribacteria bacterium]|nr:hypothetical protein [Candidatus Peribacteria bacterium]